MNRPALRLSAALTLALALGGCAVGGFVAETPTMPAARAALRPEYRLFYDALQDYGDWVLIEPYGFMFRPRVDFATFRPYGDGFWAPSDHWGWVWISAEPFGWATYHYGFWTWDRFQGWVWGPGVDWGPAWVTWEIAGGYAGWAPLPPAGGGHYANVPGGPYLYAPVHRLGSTDVSAHTLTRAELGAAAEGARPVDNPVERDGVRFNFGPDFALVERARGGPLPRVRIDEAVSPTAGAGRRREAAPEAVTPQVEATRQAATAAAEQARTLIKRGGASPSRLRVPRPAAIQPPGADPAGDAPSRRPRAAADTLNDAR